MARLASHSKVLRAKEDMGILLVRRLNRRGVVNESFIQ